MARTRRGPPAPDPAAELVQLAIDLDLTGLADALPNLLLKAEKEALSFTDFALALLRAEASVRAERRLHRSLKYSKLTDVEGLDGFDFASRPKLTARVVKELLGGQFVEQHRNVLCLGRAGLGKTRIAKAIAHAACLAGYSVLFVVAAEMLEILKAAKADGTFQRALRRLTKPDLLVLDEFGYAAFDAEQTNDLFRLVSKRHRKGSIILTSNTGFKQWKNLFPNEAMAVATVDRLVDDATILRFTGSSRRTPREIVGAPLTDE